MNTKRNVVMAEAAINGVSLADAARRAGIEYPRLQRVREGTSAGPRGDPRSHEEEGNMSTKIQLDNRACGDTKRFLDVAAVWRKLVAAPFLRGANTVCTMCRMCRILHIDSHGKTRTISTFVQKNTFLPYYQRKGRKEVRRTRKGWSDFVYRAQPLFSPEKRIRETQFSLLVAATGQPGRTTP